MSTKKDSREKNGSRKVPKAQQNLSDREYELQRSQLLEIYRTNSMRTLSNIRQGLVNELDVDQLQNFLQTSLALMQLVSVPTFRQAQRNAELLGFLKGGHEVVLDPKKQPMV
jgi:uncharacterized protein YjgD (DUF1641 family)